MSMFTDKLKRWMKEAEEEMEKAIETGDVTGLKKVVNDLRDLGFGNELKHGEKDSNGKCADRGFRSQYPDA